MYIVVILLGTSVGASTSAEAFLNMDTLKIVVLGLVAFACGTFGGVMLGKVMCKLTGGKINPLIGSAGVSAVPMAARVSQLSLIHISRLSQQQLQQLREQLQMDSLFVPSAKSIVKRDKYRRILK